MISNNFDSLKGKYDLLDLGDGSPNYGPPDILSNALADATLGNYSFPEFSMNVEKFICILRVIRGS